MSIFEFDYYKLDEAIDERIEKSNNIRDEWGTKIFDSEGRLRSSEDFSLEPYTLLGIIQYQQEQITELVERYAFTDTIITNSKIDSSMLESLLERVKVLEKDNAKYFKAFNSDISSLDIRLDSTFKNIELLLERMEILEKEVEKL